jgi:hypothetical protein
MLKIVCHENAGESRSWQILGSHGLINDKDTKTKCCLYWCLIEFIDWRYSQSCSYFRPSFVNYCPFNLLSGSPLTPLPRTVYTDSVWLVGDGVLSCVEDHILQELDILFLTRFTTYKIAFPSLNKSLGEKGASDR